MAVRDVIIVGGGPAGLATAIALKQHGLDYLVLEKGVLVDAIYRFPTNMVFFTTPELLEIGGVPLTTPYEKPTRAEALQYYRKVADLFDLQVVLQEEVAAVEPGGSREPGTAFAVASRSPLGAQRVREARAVVLAMGYYGLPNRLNIPGEDLPTVSHYYSEAHRYYRERVVIVGGKNSACEAALELHRAGAKVTLVHRGPALGESVKYWVKPDIENRIKEGSIAARFNTRVVEIKPTEVIVETTASRTGSGRWFRRDAPPGESPLAPKGDAAGHSIPADSVLLLTGYHADEGFLRRAGVKVNPDTLEPLYNHDTFETNVQGLFVAGGQLAGKRTGSVFIENGRFHGERIARVLAERLRR
jgi:thioredoxin reductase (NADPH)